MSYYSTNYYGEDGTNNLINQKPTLLAPISFLKNKFDEESSEDFNTEKINSDRINNLKNNNTNTITSKSSNNPAPTSPSKVESFNSNNEDSITSKYQSTTMINPKLDENFFPNENILNKNDSNSSKLESSNFIKHTDENFLNTKKENIDLNHTFNDKNNYLNSTDKSYLKPNEVYTSSKNSETNKIYKNYNKIYDPSFQFFPCTNSKWFGINIEKSDVSNIFFNDFKLDENSNSLNPTQVQISANKFKYISHTNLNCLCLQPKYDKDSKKFQPAYVMQVIKNLDFMHFYELKFWISKVDYNYFKAKGAANSSTYNLRLSATLFLNDISNSLSEFLEDSKNWPLTLNNTFLKFSYSPLFQILIPEGTPNEIILTGSTDSPILSDYKFNFYNYIPNFDDANLNKKNNDLIKSTEATLVFIAEALDPNNPAGLCFLDDISFF